MKEHYVTRVTETFYTGPLQQVQLLFILKYVVGKRNGSSRTPYETHRVIHQFASSKQQLVPVKSRILLLASFQGLTIVTTH